MSQNLAGLHPHSLNITTYISNMTLCIKYGQYADLLTIISMTIVHKNNKSCLPMNNATKLNSQSQFNCTESCHFLRELLGVIQLGQYVTSFHVLHYIVSFFFCKQCATVTSISYTIPESFTNPFTSSSHKASKHCSRECE